MVEINGGLVADIRWLPREVQVQACRQGMIPYVPADRETGEEEPNADPDVLARIKA